MTFHIYRNGRTFSMTDGHTEFDGFATEADAADMAIRGAQDRGALYTLNYWRP